MPLFSRLPPTPVLRTDIAHSQSGDQSSESEETESENSASDEDQLDALYVHDEDHTDDDEEYFAKWQGMQQRENMAVTAYDDHSDGEDMPDLVGSDNESNDSKQSHQYGIMEMTISHLNKFLTHC